MSRLRPCSRPPRPVISPASETWKNCASKRGARPARLLELPPDAPADVESPDRAVGWEVQALEGDGELRAPALVRARRRNVPDGIPVFVRLAVREHEAVDQGAVRVRREVEGIALIAERIEQQFYVVVGPEGRIAGHLRREDSVRLGVMTHHADVEVVGVAQQGDLRALARRDALRRDALNQAADLRRRLPRRLVQDAVDEDRLRHRRDDGRAGRPARLLLTESGDRRSGTYEGQQGPERKQRQNSPEPPRVARRRIQAADRSDYLKPPG